MTVTSVAPFDFDAPFAVHEFVCRAERPFAFPHAPGSTPSTTLAGLFERILLAVECRVEQFLGGDGALAEHLHTARDRRTNPPCWTNGAKWVCSREDECPCAALFHRSLSLDGNPSSRSRRVLPNVCRLSAPELWEREERDLFALRLSLIGHRAVAKESIALAALERLGRVGLDVRDAGRARFEARIERTVRRGTCADAISLRKGTREALIEFVTPCIAVEETRDPDGRRQRLFQAGGAFDLPRLLGNTAYDACCLDIAERPERYGAEARLRLGVADRCRVDAIRAAGRLEIARSRLVPFDGGERESKSSRGAYVLRGFTGYAVACGDLVPVLPWLSVASLFGVGQQRSKGFGDIAVWGA